MEKVIYLLWPGAEGGDGFARPLRTTLADKLLALGARAVQVNVMDADVASATPLRMTSTRPQPEAMVSLWIDSAGTPCRRPFDEAIAPFAGRHAAYLVSESLALPNRLHAPQPGKRTEGWAQIALLSRPPRISHEAWRHVWQESHTQIAIDTQSTFHYAQNLVLRSLTYGAPAYDAIVEEGFPAAAMTDSLVFFGAAGDKEKHKRHMQAMRESCARFIDMDRIDVLPTSQYVIKAL